MARLPADGAQATSAGRSPRLIAARKNEEGASLRFEEFSAHGVLTSEFFLDDNRLLGRALLWLGGASGDRQKGMDQLALAASRGRYLRPYAKALLFLASLREGQTARARALIEELTAEFPASPLFARERAKLGS